MPQNAGGPRHGSGGGSGGGGAGTVTSVNGDPGPAVSLDASEIPFTPAGGIAATDTQAAVVEAASDAASALAGHESDTTNIHGIADTSVLETVSGAQAKADAKVSDAVYGAGWDADTTHAASKNAVYDKIETVYKPGGTDVAVTDGGTGASDAGTARYNLHDQMLAAVKAVSIANVASKSGTTTIDGVSLGVGDYVLLTAQSAGAENGPWVIAAGAWTRPPDYPAAGTVISRAVVVTNGTAYSGTYWVSPTFTAVTVDTTSTTWALSNRMTAFALTLAAAATAAAARTTLGLGDLSTQNRPALNMGRLNVCGHSWIAGATVGTTGTPYMEMQGMLARVAGLFGVHNDNIMNFAQSASSLTRPDNVLSTAPYGGWSGALQYLVPSNATFINDASTSVITHGPATPGAGLLVHGINDFVRNSASQATQGRNAWKHALRTYFSLSRTGSFYKHSYLNSVFTWDTQLTFSGFATTTTQTIGNSGGAVRGTATNTDYVEFLIPADFRGGVIPFCFIGGKGGYGTLNGAMTNVATSLVPNTSAEIIASFAVGDVVTVAAEDMLITAVVTPGTNYTVTRGVNGTSAVAHSNADPVFHAVTTSKVNWSTSGSNASITGSTQLSGQGYGGSRVSVVKRFACTSADAGKTIRATVAGFVASETQQVQFDSVWIEAELVPPLVVLNVPRFAYGVGYQTLNSGTVVADGNADTNTVIAEFDANIKVADIDALIWGKGGTVKTTTVTSTTLVVTANALATWDIAVNDTISINGSTRRVTAISGPSGSDYTLTLSSSGSFTAGVAVANAKYFHTDFIHWNGVGHGVVAGIMYDAFAAITSTTSSQLGNTSATWVQDQRSGRLGVVSGQYLVPVNGWSSQRVSTINQVCYTPVDIPEECWITGYSIAHSAATAAAQAVVGIYDNDSSNGRPGGIIANIGTTTVSGTGAVSYNVPDVCYVRIRPGRYWVALKSVAQTATWRGIVIGGLPVASFHSAPSGANPGNTGYVETYATAGLPATATPTEISTVTAQPFLQLRAAEYA